MVFNDKPMPHFLLYSNSLYEGIDIFEDEEAHEASGVGHLDGGHSGRYPWGSGNQPFQRKVDFLSRIDDLEKQGLSQIEVAVALGFVKRDRNGDVIYRANGQPWAQVDQLRIQKQVAKDALKMDEVAEARRLRQDGYSLNEIAEKLGYKNDSSVRNLLNDGGSKAYLVSFNAADILKKKVDESEFGMLDVGLMTSRQIGLKSEEKMNQALYILEKQGYKVYGGGVAQPTNHGKQTNLRVLCKPGVEHKDIYDTEKIASIEDYYVHDGAETFTKFMPPASLDSKRLSICYKEDGGIEKDGVIELRRGVKDLSLGESNYAQVRIMVDGTHYLKGMAVYADDLPDGIDVRFNTNKSNKLSKLEVLKPCNTKKDGTIDQENPFKSLIKPNGQSYYPDPNGKYKDPVTGEPASLSLINKRADQSDWSDWSNAVPSQFLAKQSMYLINKQLNLSIADKKYEYDEICAMTNPTIKKIRLAKFAEDCDSAAVNLKAASFPSQRYHVILPVNSISENEVYAPGYTNGTKLALIRYPHGGLFEIPILTVNNGNKTAEKLIGNTSTDAVCINKAVADRLSGADFDGDTVMAIPVNDKTRIMNKEPLEGLQHYVYPDGHIDIFDTKEAYPPIKDKKGNIISPVLPKGQIQNEMGRISNLLTDMTLKGASDDELAAADRHSMVIIDANKHGLNYKQSYKDNNIEELKRIYQKRVDENGKTHYGGASTLISRSKGRKEVDKRQGSPRIDKETGELSYKLSDQLYYQNVTKTFTDENGVVQKKTYKSTVYKDRDGNFYGKEYDPSKPVKKRTQTSTQMAETNDAYSLISDRRTPQEIAYANYANSLKSLANTARKEIFATGKIAYSRSAENRYREEVDNINAQLNTINMNKPRERKAAMIANSRIKAQKKDNPDMTLEEIKKLEQIEMQRARAMVGSKHQSIDITEKQWEAIQAGAFSDSKLQEVFKHVPNETLISLSTPKKTKEVSQFAVNKAKAMAESGYTIGQIAEAIGRSPTTVSTILKSN